MLSVQRNIVRIVVTGIAIAALIQSGDLAAQIRGLPTLFEPSNGYDTRLGVDAGWWGESAGTTLSINASHQLLIGNCPRVSGSVYVNAINAAGGPEMLGGASLSAAVMVLPCPLPNSIVNPGLWIIGGAGSVQSQGSARMDALIGLGAGYLVDEFAVVKIEPRVTAAMHYRESLIDSEDSSWKPDVSLGLSLGVGGSFGIRTAVGCCIDGASYTVGISLWE